MWRSKSWREKLEDDIYHDLYDSYQEEKRREGIERRSLSPEDIEERERRRMEKSEKRKRKREEYEERPKAWAKERETECEEAKQRKKYAEKAIPDSLIKRLIERPRTFRSYLMIPCTIVLAFINPLTLIAIIPLIILFVMSNSLDDGVGGWALLGSCIVLDIFAFCGNMWFGIVFLGVAIITGILLDEKLWLFSLIIGLVFDIGIAIFYGGSTFAYVLPASLVVVVCFMLYDTSKKSNPIRQLYFNEAKRSLSTEMYQDLVRDISKPNMYQDLFRDISKN